MIYVGIDPDCQASGLAIIDTERKVIENSTVRFMELVKYAESIASSGIKVFIENICTTTHNWHIPSRVSKEKANAMGIGLGKCQQTQSLITELMQFKGIQITPILPLKKCWKGKDGKITHGEVMEIIKNAGYSLTKSKTNQEERDALLIAWSRTNLPLKVNTL